MYIVCRREFAFQVFFGDSYPTKLKEEWNRYLTSLGFTCKETREYDQNLPLITVSMLHADEQTFYANLIEAGIMTIPDPAMELAAFLTRWHHGDVSATYFFNFLSDHLFDIINAIQGDGDAWARLIP